jgi:hypothetical protein
VALAGMGKTGEGVTRTRKEKRGSHSRLIVAPLRMTSDK